MKEEEEDRNQRKINDISLKERERNDVDKILAKMPNAEENNEKSNQ